jgi:hypothetical protein
MFPPNSMLPAKGCGTLTNNWSTLEVDGVAIGSQPCVTSNKLKPN